MIPFEIVEEAVEHLRGRLTFWVSSGGKYKYATVKDRYFIRVLVDYVEEQFDEDHSRSD